MTYDPQTGVASGFTRRAFRLKVFPAEAAAGAR
jgi:hypothetical protein